MHLNDSIGRCRDIEYICNHHEQACAMAAEGYARVSGKIGVLNVTTGPGGINALNGVFGAWTDSIPMLVISGQVKRETCLATYDSPGLRQLGDQEADIIGMVKGITKYAVLVNYALSIRYHLERALYLAASGRPGPCWIDIPLDIQGAVIDEYGLKAYDPAEDRLVFDESIFRKQISEVLERLEHAQRPIFLAGQGIRIARAHKLFLEVAEKTGIPVVTSFSGFDLIPSDHQLHIGRVGTIGGRAGNFALQNADLLICIGSRNNIRQVSYNWNSFARAACKIVVDVDPAELEKPTVKPDLPILADARIFLDAIGNGLKKSTTRRWESWGEWCRDLKTRYPVVLTSHRDSNELNPYYFMELLTELLENDAVAVAGNGTACVTLFQAGKVKPGQRIFWNSGCASMGYDLPAAIGACFAGNGKDVICLAGDGSLQMNIQELQTVVHYRLPIKIFVLDNNGYNSIRQTQKAFFSGNYVGCGPDQGVSFPDIVKLAGAYGLKTETIGKTGNLREKISGILKTRGPVICNVRLSADYSFEPKLSSERKADGRIVSKPLEDMYPFLDRNEFRSNMLIPVYDEEGNI